jgi:hypothetical protein
MFFFFSFALILRLSWFLSRKSCENMGSGPLLVFLGIMFGLLMIYFVVGTLVRYHKGLRHFPEVLPNYRFWRECGIMCCDAFMCVVTCGKYTGASRRGGSGSAVLPTNPMRSGSGGFEQLPAEVDDFDEDEAMQPSVVVQY